MSFVTPVAESQAGPELRPLYAAVRQDFGFLPMFFQVLGTTPHLAVKQWELLKATMQDGALPRVTKEKMLLVVSGINSSSYCVAAHMDVLQRFKIERAVARKLATHYHSAPVEPREMVLFEFAEKLTRDSAGIQKQDADAVMAAGWSEEALIEAAITIAWANFINRVAFGLGIVAEF